MDTRKTVNFKADTSQIIRKLEHRFDKQRIGAANCPSPIRSGTTTAASSPKASLTSLESQDSSARISRTRHIMREAQRIEAAVQEERQVLCSFAQLVILVVLACLISLLL